MVYFFHMQAKIKKKNKKKEKKKEAFLSRGKHKTIKHNKQENLIKKGKCLQLWPLSTNCKMSDLEGQNPVIWLGALFHTFLEILST